MSNNNCSTTDSLLPPNSRYKIYEKIGSGAYGEVYKGTRDDDGLFVALKRVMITDEDGYNNIPLSTHRELNVLRRLNKIGNDNIVRLFDIVLNKIGNRMCIDLVFELSEYDLESYLKHFNMGGDMPIAKILNLGQQLMDGVQFMHSYRVLHRDLKPANILVDRNGTDLKITDFGLARILGFDAALTPIAVTLWYRSPEILFKNSYLTSCDVWSVGCIIGEMVYGRPLFAAENEVKQMEKIVCRLGYEAINHWPEDSFIDSSSFVSSIDASRSIDRILRRADAGLRGLIKSLLRFDPDHRMLSTDALARLNELRRISTMSNGCTLSSSSMGGMRICPVPESQDFMVVNSVVRNVLDDDYTETAEDTGPVIPGLVDCQSIQDYPHEEVEVTESSDVSLDSDQDDVDDDLADVNSTPQKNTDELGDSFSSYRSQNNESFSSYGPSSQTGVESTDEDVCGEATIGGVGTELCQLREITEGFLLSDASDSDTCQADLTLPTDPLETTVVLDEDDPGSGAVTSRISPESVSTLAVSIDGPMLGERSPLTRKISVPLQERNVGEDGDVCASTAKVSLARRHTLTRKRIIDNSDDDENNDFDEEYEDKRDGVCLPDTGLENRSPCPPLPVHRPMVPRHKSLRRRLSVNGPHQGTDRPRSTIGRCFSVIVPAAIDEDNVDETHNQSFGETSLARALDDVPVLPGGGGDPNSPLTTTLTARPKILVRRRSQFK